MKNKFHSGLNNIDQVQLHYRETTLFSFSGRSVAYAQEDEVDGEEDDIIDDEEVNVDDGTESEVEQVDGTEEEEEEEEMTAKGSPDADTIIYFTKPVGTGSGQFGRVWFEGGLSEQQ